jgi:hypothetical protein
VISLKGKHLVSIAVSTERAQTSQCFFVYTMLVFL